MNLQVAASIVLICLYLICVFFLARSLIQIVNTGVLALQSGNSEALEKTVKPIPYSTSFWLALVWIVVSIGVLARATNPLLDAPVEAIGLSILSVSVITITLLALWIISNLNRYGVYDLNFWALMTLRVSIAFFIIGAGILGVTLIPGTGLTDTSVFHWNSAVFPVFLKLLGLMVIIVITTLGLISNGWIKTILGLDASEFHVRISSVSKDQSLESNRGDDVDLETEFFFHIRNLKHDTDV